MRKKITALLAIVLLSAQTAPVFAQYGPNGLCDADQMRMCGEQARKYFNKAVHFVAKHRDDIFGSPFLTSPLHYTIWKIQRNGEKAKMQQERNRRTIVNTKSYEQRGAQKQNPPKKQEPAKKPAPAKKK